MVIEINAPRVGRTTEAITIINWLKKEGDSVEKGEPVVEIESDKATIELEAPASGVLLKILALEETVVPVGVAFAFLGDTGEVIPQHLLEKSKGAIANFSVTSSEIGNLDISISPDTIKERSRKKVTPVARKLAKELGVSLEKVQGSGPDGAVTADDVRIFHEKGKTEIRDSEEEILPLLGWRRSMAEKMTLSHRFVASDTTFAEVDMAKVTELRKKVDATYTAYVIKATIDALKAFPLLNSSVLENGIIVKKHIHMGVSVAISEGVLMAVVIRDAHAKTLEQIDEELKVLAERARTGKVSPEEITGATFTVTNSGVLGSIFYTPVVDYPQMAILGMGKIMDTPVVRDQQIVIRPIMYLCLTFDHRIIGGPVAVPFLQKVKQYLEDPDGLQDVR